MGEAQACLGGVKAVYPFNITRLYQLSPFFPVQESYLYSLASPPTGIAGFRDSYSHNHGRKCSSGTVELPHSSFIRYLCCSWCICSGMSLTSEYNRCTTSASAEGPLRDTWLALMLGAYDSRDLRCPTKQYHRIISALNAFNQVVAGPSSKADVTCFCPLPYLLN